MRMLFVQANNIVLGEDVSANKTFIERAGYHMAPPETIYRHEFNKDETITIIPQGRIVAFGAVQDKMFINDTQMVIDVAKFLGNKPTVDSEFMRWIKLALKNAGPIILILVGIGILLSMANTGAI